MNLKDIMLNEISQAQKDKYSMISLMWNVEQSIRRNSIEWWLPGVGVVGMKRRNEEMLVKGYKFPVM